MQAKTNPWGKPTGSTVARAALSDIMSEQRAESFLTEDNYDDYELALKLQFEEDNMNHSLNQETQDKLYAELLQSQEDQLFRQGQIPVPSDTMRFQKVELKTEFESLSIDSNAHVSSVNSSSYHAAVMLEKDLELLKPEKLLEYSRHDPLLRSLNASKALSELDGVGDLTGEGLLVSKNVGNSVRQFVHKQEKKSSRKQHQQSGGQPAAAVEKLTA